MHTCSRHAAGDPHSARPYSRVTPEVKRGEVGVARGLGRKEHWGSSTCPAERQQTRAFGPALNACMHMYRGTSLIRKNQPPRITTGP